MKKVFVGLFFLSSAFAQEGVCPEEVAQKIFKKAWEESYRVCSSLKTPKRVIVPAGWRVVLDAGEVSTPLLAFYYYAGMREGLRPAVVGSKVIYGVFDKRADAVALASRLRAKELEVKVEWGEAEQGVVGEPRTVFVEPHFGTTAIIYHLKRAIAKAQDLDPSVFNRDLLIKDLKAILSQIKAWEAGHKGYVPVVYDPEKEAEAIDEVYGKIKKFVEEER